MTSVGCEHARDLLARREGLEPAREAELRAHLAACADCRAEAALIEALRGTVPAASDALRERVSAAARAELAGAGAPGDERGHEGVVPIGAARRRRPSLRYLTMAASFAAATLLGVLLWQQTRGVPLPPSDAAPPVDGAPVAGVDPVDAAPDEGTTPEGGRLEGGVLPDEGIDLAQVTLPVEQGLDQPSAWPGSNGIIAGGVTFDGLSDAELESLLRELES